MRHIELLNYRCFNNLSLFFKQQTNLLVGDNASGKTTILKALQTAMSTFFCGYSDENTRFSGLTKNDFSEVFNEHSKVNEKPITLRFDYLKNDPDFDESLFPVSYVSLKNKKSRTSIAGAKPIIHWARELQENLFDQNNNQVHALPLFASFSTGDIFVTRKINASKFKEYVHKPSFGYYECLQGDGFFPYWIKRMLVLAEGKKGELELEGVQKAINKALGKDGCNIIESFSIRPIQGKVYYHFTDGREVDSEKLSDGYARLVNIVTDLAFRCMLLNQGVYNISACEETQGTVLIDEIDLHLHPTLQPIVINGLQRAFPKLQFIISTHAPMVMTGLLNDDKNQIFHLRYDQGQGYTVNRISTYGMDASTIIQAYMNVVPRDKWVQIV